MRRKVGECCTVSENSHRFIIYLLISTSSTKYNLAFPLAALFLFPPLFFYIKIQWEDLSTSEKEAATTLGWDQSGWDNHYEDKSWEDLPSKVQSAAGTLGFTADMWNDDDWPESTDKWWTDFSDEQKKALNTLGYSQYDWEE